ncbi:MAG: porphobilinogen synthase [Bacteroidota bacterium]
MTLIKRNRRLRTTEAIRALIRETHITPNDFLTPLFVVEGNNKKEEIASMPDYFRYSLDVLEQEVKALWTLGLKSVLLFVKVADHLKDNKGTEALNPDGLMQRSIRAIKKHKPSMCVMSDVALDTYYTYGHDGIVEYEEIVNDKTNTVLAKMALSHAQAGCDIIAPSDMMDGRIGAIRDILEENNFHTTGIMSYSAKYASCFYGPFRDALDSAPGFGDKKTYQMNPANRLAAMREVALDIEEGSDIIMIKPALSYLDIIRETRNAIQVPIAAYHVSGEYAMIKASAAKGWIDEKQAILETTLSIKRAGANLIATYFAKDIVTLIR